MPVRSFLAAAALLAAASSALAYPISPRPLRKLIVEADLIVLAEVSATRRNPADPDEFASHLATLKVKEALKGTLPAELQVSFHPNMCCPSPAHYEPKTTVLAFLSKSEQGWRTTALSYGVKQLVDKRTHTTYLTRTREMLEILKLEDPRQRDAKTVAWLVACALEPATRWEGAYELAPEGDLISGYERSLPREFKRGLSEEHATQLMSTFEGSESLETHGDSCIAQLLAARDDFRPRLAARILKQLRAYAKQRPETVYGLTKWSTYYAHLEGWEEGVRMAEQIGYEKDAYERFQTFQQIVEERLAKK